MNLKLVKPNENLEKEHLDFLEEWQDEEITPMSANIFDMDYKSWLDYTYRIEKEATCPNHLVPAHTFFLVLDSKKIIGAINIRHRLNDYLFNYGGHIGYGIRPSERKKGYASKMLALALPIAKEIGIEKLLVTCDKDNIASRKTILKNGGILENEVRDKDEIVQRYWIGL